MLWTLLYPEFYEAEFFIDHANREHFFLTADASFQVKGT